MMTHGPLDAQQDPLAGPGSRSVGSLIASQIEQQVALRPDAAAVTLDGASLTYGILNARANQLAACLRELGVGPESLVGIHLDRSFELVIGILAILKAGGAYLPLDLACPETG